MKSLKKIFRSSAKSEDRDTRSGKSNAPTDQRCTFASPTRSTAEAPGKGQLDNGIKAQPASHISHSIDDSGQESTALPLLKSTPASQVAPDSSAQMISGSKEAVKPAIHAKVSMSSMRSKSTPASAAKPGGSQSIPDLSLEVMLLIEQPTYGKEFHCSQSIIIPDDPPNLVKAYEMIPLLEQTILPRGGASVDTKAVGRVQFGIPPETIKDSMKLGIPVPQVYIVPVDRFCREMGPALGVNLAEFEFPAYFNFFVYKKKCTLVVDSDEAEENIRRVFGETLLGPHQFRREDNPIAFEEEDFAPEFPREAIPDFQKEFKHFRIMPDGKELTIETLLNFYHFEAKKQDNEISMGVPPSFASQFLLGKGDDSDNGVEDDNGHLKGLNTEDEVTNSDGEVDDDIPASLPKMNAGRRDSDSGKQWSYAQLRHICDVAVVWPFDATAEQIKAKSVPRVEIFKMPGGTEYIIHDVDATGVIIGKARFSGHVRVSEQMGVDGFGGHSILDDVKPKEDFSFGEEPSEALETVFKPEGSPTFYPPSFGVTVLGNSHGFDKSGSVSGYVLWINGRGVMIDPPPYSSATLEREGIRPRAIVGIILTHCHADHDAGAFQKVLTGSPVVVITTPTIYKSFIRKYAALSALSPAILRHCHRFKPAIIGQPLRFQGATFQFIYSFHTIPCIGFRVEWRGRSMVFTGDHFNSPEGIDKLQENGVLSQARADDLRNLPMQECDLILHEAGAPPIHTPLDVLMKLPQRIKDRLYIVHTAALPDDCDLRVAPTGTAGTIRLDQDRQDQNTQAIRSSMRTTGDLGRLARDSKDYSSSLGGSSFLGGSDDSNWGGQNEYETISEESSSIGSSGTMATTSFAHLNVDQKRPNRRPKSRMMMSVYKQGDDMNQPPPLVSLRPASSTDAWFLLSLLSAVPFMSSLSYTHTMAVLETARVDAYPMNSIVVPANKRNQILCVVWEGACSERAVGTSGPLVSTQEQSAAIWHAGDWTGPISLQPEKCLSGESCSSASHDIIALSNVGAKVVTIEMPQLHAILKAGSPLYQTYLERTAQKQKAKIERSSVSRTEICDSGAKNPFNVLELLNSNSALKKLNAVQKRHLECLAEGPVEFSHGDRMWRAGAPVDKAFLIISGTCVFAPKRRNAGSVTSSTRGSDTTKHGQTGISDVGDTMRFDAHKVRKELEELAHSDDDNASDRSEGSYMDHLLSMSTNDVALFEAHDFEKLSRGLQKRAEYLANGGTPMASAHSSKEDLDSITGDCTESHLDHTFMDEGDPGTRSRRESVVRRRSSRARLANKVLGRLYSRQASSGGLVFSRGHFLGDMSKMVAGILANDMPQEPGSDSTSPVYGFDGSIMNLFDSRINSTMSPEEISKIQLKHSSTLIAGKDGCVAFVFTKSNLIGFLDEYPGFLLSLLGTHAVV